MQHSSNKRKKKNWKYVEQNYWFSFIHSENQYKMKMKRNKVILKANLFIILHIYPTTVFNFDIDIDIIVKLITVLLRCKWQVVMQLQNLIDLYKCAVHLKSVWCCEFGALIVLIQWRTKWNSYKIILNRVMYTVVSQIQLSYRFKWIYLEFFFRFTHRISYSFTYSIFYSKLWLIFSSENEI